MKPSQTRSYILAFIALWYMTACSPGGVSSRRVNCSYQGEVCISLDTSQSFSRGDPVELIITITSTKDIDPLHVTIDTGTDITITGTETWEKGISNPIIHQGFATWDFAIQAGRTISFTRVLHFPSAEGNFHVIGSAVTVGRSIVAVDDFRVLLTRAGGQVIKSGTPYPPYTPNVTPAAYGPGTPAPTFLINPTNGWLPTPVPDALSTSTQLAEPYPAASSVPPSAPDLPPTTSPYP